MQQKKTYKITGIFVIVGLLCLAGIILRYCGDRFSTNSQDLVVMYFEESIRGLNVGAPVVFKGVQVGKVAKIHLVADLEDTEFTTRVYVLFDIKSDVKVVHDSDEYDENFLDKLIEKGLRARLVTANYLTGQLMIELVMDPKEPVVMRGLGRYLEIPTEYSSFEMLSKDLQEIPVRQILSKLDNILDSTEENLPPMMSNMNQILKQIDRVMERKNSEASKTMRNFNNTLEEISKASRSMKNLTDYLERHPEAVIQGKE